MQNGFASTWYGISMATWRPPMDEVGFQSNAGVLAFRSAKGGTASKYVCFDDCNLYYDVSTPAMMAEQRIEVVDVLNIP